MAIQGIYAAIVNDSIAYVGSSVDCKARWATHQRELKNRTHGSQPMQRACDKYGLSSFSFSMIEYVDLRDRLLQREQCWIDFFKPRYNTSKFAGHPTLGLKHSDETKAKMSRARKGKKRPPFSEEWKKNIREARRLRPNVISAEGRKKIREAQLGNKHSLGHYPSEETRKKLSLARMGNKNALGFKYPPGAYDSRLPIGKKK